MPFIRLGSDTDNKMHLEDFGMVGFSQADFINLTLYII